MSRVKGDQPGFLPRFRRRINGGPSEVLAAGATGALFLLIVLFCLTRITDTDLFWHLATGDLIRRTGHVPHSEPFSYTALGLPWVDIQWLYQVGVSYLKEIGGFGAVHAATALLVGSLFAFLYRQGRRLAGAAGVVAVLLLATLACQERFLTRPEVASWWFLAATFAGLEAALGAETQARRRIILWIALPLLQVVWVNIQVLFALGPAMAGLALLSAAGRGAIRPSAAWERQRGPGWQAVDLLAGLAIEAVASLVNPFGALALRLPFETFFDHLGGTSLLSRSIAEFQPTLLARPVTTAIVAFVLFAVAVLLALLLNARRVRLFDLLIALATLFVALRARRNIPIFVVATVPILLRCAAQSAEAWRARRPSPWIAAMAPAALLLAALTLCADVVSNRFFLRPPTERWWGTGMIPYYFPEDAARFVAHTGLPGQVFHPLEVGGYLIKIWDGDRRVFIDGRNDPYRFGVLESYLKAVADPAAFEEMTREYQITMVLWTHRRSIEGKELLAHLEAGNGWSKIYVDPAAVVFARSDLVRPGLARVEALPAGEPPAAVYARLLEALDRRPFDGPPIREIALGHYFSISGDPAGAEFFLGRAIERLPRSAALLHDYGLALQRQGRRAEARAAYESALEADPGMAKAMGALGALALDDGDLATAERLLDAAYRGGERSALVLSARARLFERQGKARDAADAWGETILAAPARRPVLLAAARFYVRRNEPGPALALYGRLLDSEPGDSIAAVEKAQILEGLGRLAESLAVLRVAGERVVARLGAPQAQAAQQASQPEAAPDDAGDPEAGAQSQADDLRLLEMAARLEERAGDKDKARQWRRAMLESGGSGGS